MKNALAFMAAATLVLIGVGWYLGWYTLQSTTSAKGTHQVNIDFNDDKIKSDIKKGGEKVADKVEEIEKSRKANEGSASVSDPGKLNLPVPKLDASKIEIPKQDPAHSEPPTFVIPSFTIQPAPNR